MFIVLLYISTHTSLHAQWQTAISNTTNTLIDVSYGGGQWVAVGVNGIIVTSADGIDWTPRMSNTTKGLSNAAYNGSQWIVVGQEGTILSSTDGITWAAQQSNTTTELTGITYGDGQWLAVEFGSATVTSPDGINWTRHPVGHLFYGVSYGPNQYVGVGGSSIKTSTNGINWQEVKNIGSRERVYEVSYGNGQWVAVGSRGIILSSSDGVNWTYAYFRYSPEFYDVNYGDGLWIAIGPNGFYGSSNGTNWGSVSQPQSINDINGYSQATGISYGAGKWVAIGPNGKIAYNYSVAAPLPVSLVSFTGQSEGTTAHLSWETAWEKGASHFVIERSQNAKSFEAIGRMEAKDNINKNQSYNFFDSELAAGLWYYRLRQVDLDGTYVYSSIVAVRISTEPLPMLTLSPNPSAGPLLLEYKAGISSVSVYSLTGVLIQEQRFEQAVNQWSWNGQDQPSGAYLIKVQTQDRNQQTLRWVKQ
ncbi:T9SS type A sorting domain-containing protein [Spirosoma validum]|uniref:T9SS type A sorting domain-containing protein n=1 Tax=Spirosoma validum TaxID=2771355 RepID=A0A927B602_9BACT|nr:T9SS type A sorting domain-containing protein [Spirosoma validum]MBD2756291.1 T9SS type A sorting domain-containing protein [Spirosoma validum]